VRTIEAVGLVKAGVTAVVAVLAAAPVAQAAYAPKLEVKLDPATAKSPAAITSRITQAAGETASKTVKVVFPMGFTVNAASKVKPCAPDQEAADSCPGDSKVGAATAVTSLGSLTGPVYFENKTGQLQLVVYLEGFGGLVKQKLIGTINYVAGRLETVFDGLPNTPTTAFVLELQGGDKALALTPAQCGPATFDAAFTSQNGEQATAQAKIDIAGCTAAATTPGITGVKVAPRAFRAVRKFSDTQRRGYGTTLRWTLSEATGATRITVQRRVAGRWRKAGSFPAGGDAGANKLRWDGRLGGKPLKPGSYRFLLQATGKNGTPSTAAGATFTIKR
jgi:hypothetical protein